MMIKAVLFLVNLELVKHISVKNYKKKYQAMAEIKTRFKHVHQHTNQLYSPMLQLYIICLLSILLTIHISKTTVDKLKDDGVKCRFG